jgi:hypothetical protein
MRTIPVLSVSPIEEDHLFLAGIFSINPSWIPCADCNWKLHTGLTLDSALTVLQEKGNSNHYLRERFIPGHLKARAGPNKACTYAAPSDRDIASCG